MADQEKGPAETTQEPTTPSFAEFSAVNVERCESPRGFNHPLGSWSTSDWFTAILGELGEAANVAKKLNRVRDGIPGNKEKSDELRDKLRRELGDTFVYLDLLCQSLGFNIGAAAVEVFNAKSVEIGCPILMDTKALAHREAEIARLTEERDKWMTHALTSERFRAEDADDHLVDLQNLRLKVEKAEADLASCRDALERLVKQWRTRADAILDDVNNGQAPTHEADSAREWLACSDELATLLNQTREPQP